MMMAVYVLSIAVNALVVLTCECMSHHGHDGDLCALSHGTECTADMGGSCPNFTQHCACTHSHDNNQDYALVFDGDRLLKHVRAAVAELPRTLAEIPDAAPSGEPAPRHRPSDAALTPEPLVLSGALRAPPVSA